MATYGELENFTCEELSQFTCGELEKLSLEELTAIAKSTVNSSNIPQNLKEIFLSVIGGIVGNAAYDAGKSIDWHEVMLKFIEFLHSIPGQ